MPGSGGSGAVSRWGPVAVWMVGIFLSSERAVPGAVGALPDWLTHGAAYAVLGALLGRALAGGRKASRRSALAAFLLSGAYGALDEVHQSFVPGRQADARDVAKDLGGALMGALAWRRYGIALLAEDRVGAVVRPPVRDR